MGTAKRTSVRTLTHARFIRDSSLPLRTLCVLREGWKRECGGRKAITVISRGRTRVPVSPALPSPSSPPSPAAVVANGSHL